MRYLLLALFLTSCLGTGVQPVKNRPGYFQLHYCYHQSDCFEAAAEHCAPRDYKITSFTSHPEIFVCKDK